MAGVHPWVWPLVRFSSKPVFFNNQHVHNGSLFLWVYNRNRFISLIVLYKLYIYMRMRSGEESSQEYYRSCQLASMININNITMSGAHFFSTSYMYLLYVQQRPTLGIVPFQEAVSFPFPGLPFSLSFCERRHIIFTSPPLFLSPPPPPASHIPFPSLHLVMTKTCSSYIGT